jgi:hypothetical protein
MEPRRGGTRHFFASLFPEARLQAGIKIGRRLGRLPFIEQRHRFLQIAQMGGTLVTGCDVLFDLRLEASMPAARSGNSSRI